MVLAKIYLNKLLYSFPAIATTPLFIKILGKEFWTYLASAQIIGGIFAVFIEANWRTMGIRDLTKATQDELSLVSSKYVTQRMFIFFISLPPMLMMCQIIPHHEAFLLFLAATSTASMSLSIESFFTSRVKYNYVYWIEPIAKILINVLPLFWLSNKNELFYYFLGLIAVNIYIPLIILKYAENYSFKKVHMKIDISILKFAVSKLIATSYTTFPIPLMLYFNINDLYIYVATDKLYRFIMTLYLPIIQFAQQKIHHEKNYVIEWSKIVYSTLITIPISMISMEILKRFNIVPENFVPFDFMIYFVILSSVVNLNRICEVILTDKTTSNQKSTKIYIMSTILFWSIFIFCIIFDSLTICIIACILVEIFGCFLRLKNIIIQYKNVTNL